MAAVAAMPVAPTAAAAADVARKALLLVRNRFTDPDSSAGMNRVYAAPPGLSRLRSAPSSHCEDGRFTSEELEIAWAASLWTAAHNARWEALHGDPPVAGDAVRAQATERLLRANG